MRGQRLRQKETEKRRGHVGGMEKEKGRYGRGNGERKGEPREKKNEERMSNRKKSGIKNRKGKVKKNER